MHSNKKKIAILLLAAGASTRLGQPKQLIKFGNKTLLENMTDIAINSGCEPVIITLGAYYTKIEKAIKNKPVHILNNKEWETGMGSSVACGMKFLLNNHKNIDAVILMLCDQPFLNENIIFELINKWETTGRNIIASKYNNAFGVPVLFNKNIFPELSNLNGKTGAKKIIAKYKDELDYIDFPEGEYDLDTEEDLKYWRCIKCNAGKK